MPRGSHGKSQSAAIWSSPTKSRCPRPWKAAARCGAARLLLGARRLLGQARCDNLLDDSFGKRQQVAPLQAFSGLRSLCGEELHYDPADAEDVAVGGHARLLLAGHRKLLSAAEDVAILPDRSEPAHRGLAFAVVLQTLQMIGGCFGGAIEQKPDIHQSPDSLIHLRLPDRKPRAAAV